MKEKPGPMDRRFRLARKQAPAVLAGLGVGSLVIGANYLAHVLFSVALLPEQVGVFLLRHLPLPVFSAGVATFGPFARPLLLVGATIGLILFIAVLFFLVQGLVRPRQTHPPAPIREDRRRLLRNLFVGSVALSVLPIGYVNTRRLITALATKEGSRVATEITPIGDFYVVSKNLVGDPVLDAGSWRLVLPDGTHLTYAQLLAMPYQELGVTFECISNEVGGTLISNGMWRGPRVQDVLAGAVAPASAAFLLIESADGYTESFRLSQLTPDCLLATHLNGQPLPAAHGFPARFVFPGHYGMKQPKWVTRLQFSAQDQLGYWEQVGWDEQAFVKTMSRIDSPADGSVVSAGTVRISGIAYAGVRRVSEVQVSWEKSGWHEAALEPEFSPYSWRFWHVDTQLSTGRYTIMVRARDGAGAVQTALPASTLPNGADGLHRIVLDVL